MSRLRRNISVGVWVAILGLMGSVSLGAVETQKAKANWDNLKQLTLGDQIQVVLNDAKSYRGQFQTVSDEAIVVRLATGEQKFSRNDVLRLSAQGQSRRGRNAWIGAGVGAGLGVVAVGMDCRNDRQGCSAEGVLLGVPLGAGLGALVAALVPTGGWHDVYRAR